MVNNFYFETKKQLKKIELFIPNKIFPLNFMDNHFAFQMDME